MTQGAARSPAGSCCWQQWREVKLGLSPPSGWCEQGPPRLSACLGCPSCQHLSLPRHPQCYPQRPPQTSRCGPAGWHNAPGPSRPHTGRTGLWGRLAPGLEPAGSPCRGHFAPTPWPHFPRPPWFRPGLRATFFPATQWFLPMASGESDDSGQFHRQGRARQGSFLKADSLPWGCWPGTGRRISAFPGSSSCSVPPT